MGLFESKKKKELRELSERLVSARKEGYFTCVCGRSQTITYYGNNDTWTCPQCRRRNRCY
ncbi:MAG: hypothetical protein K2L10_09045 [Ruminococcus sp.]|nr:hypothetical protein [Ruminococcus sp.]